MNQTLEKLANYLKQQLQAQLIAMDKNASNALSNSIEVVVNETVSSWRIVGSNLFYGNIQDQGVPAGTHVPIKALLEWIRQKNIRITGMRELSFAYAVKANIYKYGTKARTEPAKARWLSRTLEEEEIYINKIIRDALNEEITMMISNAIENTNKILN